jgi:nucleotide-binding universal stress UspA family protein
MPSQKRFRVLMATDGSEHARAALATALEFPWPPGTTARVVVARRFLWTSGRPQYVLDALERHLERVASGARRALRRRWPETDVAVLDASPVQAIVAEAGRFGADAVVLGRRGHGAVARMLIGSVSRGVVRSAPCAVLVARRRRETRTVVVGLDGSANARKAARFMAGLHPRRGARAVLVRVVEPVTVPSAGLLPGGVRAVIGAEAARLNAERTRESWRELRALVPALRKAGWTVRAQVLQAAPLRGLLGAVRTSRADLLCIGARGVGGVERLLLGSVAEGALNQCPVGVLVVR